MTPKTLLATILLIAGFSAHAQQQDASGKLFIINDASRSAVLSAANPAAALSQTERVELTSVNSNTVNLKKCGTIGCLDPIGTPVHIEAIRHVNADVRLQDVGEPGGGNSCRVCINTKTISTDLQDYVDRVKSVAPQFEQ